MNQRIDRPGVDESEQYVYFNSPGVLTGMDIKVYHAEVAYGWGADDPLTLDFAISVNLDSVPLDEASYPVGHICDSCLLPMPFGTVAIAVPTINDHGQTLVCVACSRDAEWSRWYSQLWDIDLSLVRSVLMSVELDEVVGKGNVQAWISMDETITFKLVGVGSNGTSEYCFLNLPTDRLEAFVREIDRYMGANDLAAVEAAFLDNGTEMLERFANGEQI